MLVSPGVDVVLFGVLGLLVGSFLNVVIYRLPKMMEAEWADNCAELAGAGVARVRAIQSDRAHVHAARAARHRSAGTRTFRCSATWCCAGAAPIARHRSACVIRPSRLVTGLVFVAVARMYGLTAGRLVWAALACLLIAQFFIDFDTQLLPDDLNYLILWLGLIASAMGWTTVPLASAVWGAVFGYLSLWTVYQVHHRLTGKQGMGHGDFKLLAGLGAWFGAEYLVALILLSSVVGSVWAAPAAGRPDYANRDIPIPFGPFLAGAGMVAMLAGPGRLESLMPVRISVLASSPDESMLRLGLTGGIGSGKSTVARFFAERRRRADRCRRHLARRSTAAGGLAIAPIAEVFGADFISPDGALDRARMRQASFSDAAARSRLEAIIHPLVGQESARLEQDAVDNRRAMHRLRYPIAGRIAPLASAGRSGTGRRLPGAKCRSPG